MLSLFLIIHYYRLSHPAFIPNLEYISFKSLLILKVGVKIPS
jgi:hypothetical protein